MQWHLFIIPPVWLAEASRLELQDNVTLSQKYKGFPFYLLHPLPIPAATVPQSSIKIATSYILKPRQKVEDIVQWYSTPWLNPLYHKK